VNIKHLVNQVKALCAITKIACCILLVMVSLPTSVHAVLPCIDAPKKAFADQNTVVVDSVANLQAAVANLSNNTTVLIKPGNYLLTKTLYITKPGTIIRSQTGRCDDVTLIGPGMENANYGEVASGIWINANNVTVANLTIRDVYFHPIELNSGPDGVEIYNVRLLDAGEQFIKSSSAGGFGQGGDAGKVEYSIMEYTSQPPLTDHGGGTGYTNGVDVHGGDGWEIRNNIFKNFHTPDNADHLWSPAILMWNGSRNTLVENNTFINVDRAISFGLYNRTNDHFGGVIRNNMITITPNLYSANRTQQSDAPIILWSSPNSKVLHNTVLTNGNTLKSVELRFGSSNVEVANNLVDKPIVYREGLPFTSSNNASNATASYFVNPSQGDLHIKASAANVIAKGPLLVDAMRDFDGQARPANSVTLGADQFGGPANPGVPSATSIVAVLAFLLDED